MLDSEYIKHYCCVPYPPYPTKVHFVNESDWEVRYEVYWYKEKELIEANVGVNAAGGGGTAGGVWTPSEKAKPEEGTCFPHDTSKITVMSGYKYYRLRYKFLHLQEKWSEESGKIDPVLVEVPGKSPDIKNFGIYEKIIFRQPPSHIRHEHSLETNKKIIEETISKKLDLIQKTVDDISVCVNPRSSSTKPKPEPEPEPTKIISPEIKEVCKSLHKHMCSSNNNRTQCPHCNYWYCDWHSGVNNSPFGRGGHVCC